MLLALMCTNIYRAATQSITIDEAFTYLNFISKPYAGLLQSYDASNHVLNTLLSRFSIAIFGLSEWSLRLTSLLGGALYLFAAYRLCFRIFGGSAWSLTTFALLATNPFLLDYLSAARGYGLAMALLVAAAYILVSSRSLYLAGLSFGLAIAANLTAIFPAVALVIAYIAVAPPAVRPPTKLWSHLAIPSILIAFVLLVLPLSKAQPQHFYYGAPTFGHMTQSLLDLSFTYGPIRVPRLSGLGDLLKRAAPAMLLILLAASVFCAALRCFFAISFVAVLAEIFAAHFLAHMPYPLTRTGLYLVPFTFLATSSVLYQYRRIAALRIAAGALAMVCLATFLLQADFSSYAEWRFDAGTKRIVNYIRSHSPPEKRLVIRTSWVMEPTLNFYRVLYHLNWEPLDRSGFSKLGDILIFAAEDRGAVPKSGWRIVYTDPMSAALVAAPEPIIRDDI